MASQSPAHGSKLVLIGLICAVFPLIIEMISDGGPSQFGKPETGYAMAASAFFLWPTAFILVLIGLKRLFVSAIKSDYEPKQLPKPDREISITDAWAETTDQSNDTQKPV